MTKPSYLGLSSFCLGFLQLSLLRFLQLPRSFNWTILKQNYTILSYLVSCYQMQFLPSTSPFTFLFPPTLIPVIPFSLSYSLFFLSSFLYLSLFFYIHSFSHSSFTLFLSLSLSLFFSLSLLSTFLSCCSRPSFLSLSYSLY